MLGSASLERQEQLARVQPRKSSPIQLAGLVSLREFVPNSLVSSVTADSLSWAGFIDPVRSCEAETGRYIDLTTYDNDVIGRNPSRDCLTSRLSRAK